MNIDLNINTQLQPIFNKKDTQIRIMNDHEAELLFVELNNPLNVAQEVSVN